MGQGNSKKGDPEKVPIIYLYLYKNLRENFKVGQCISYRNILHHITKMTYHMPRKYYDIIIKELIDFKLIDKIFGGRSPGYEPVGINYESLFKDLEKIDKSSPNNRLKILNSRYKRIMKLVEKEEDFNQKYTLLKHDYEKLLRKLELKKLEGSHYW